MLPNPLFWKVHMYGIMIAVGVLAAFLVLYGYGKKLKINSKLLDFVYYDAIVSIVLGFGCAALTQAFYDYLEHPENGFHLSGGITFMGGMVGGTALFFLFYALFRKFRQGTHFSDVLSLIPCCILVAHGFGRIGCFFAAKRRISSLPSSSPIFPTPFTRPNCTRRHSCLSCLESARCFCCATTTGTT